MACRQCLPGGSYAWLERGLLAACLLGGLAGAASAQNIDTIAGGGPDAGPALTRPVGSSRAVALDPAGNRYVVSANLNRVFKIDTAGQLTIFAGNGAPDYGGDGGPAVLAALLSPRGVAVDALGNVLISDTFNNRVRRVDTAGIITTIAGTGIPDYTGDGGPATSATLDTPEQITLDGAGNLFIADTFNHCIRRVDGVSGFISTVAGNGTRGFSGDNGSAVLAQLNEPRGIAVDAAGTLFIGDFGNHRIRRVAGGTITTFAGTGAPGFSGEDGPPTDAQLNFPLGVAVASGAVFVADSSNNRIRKVAGGIIDTVAGNGSFGFSGDNGPATSAMLGTPSGMVLDPSGHMFVADTFNNRVRRVDGGNQVITTIAGTGELSFFGDGGPALQAVLGDPRGVARDSNGDLYLADELNHRVRKVDATGTITTVAGNGVNGYGGDNGPATLASLSQPGGVTLDGAGNLYIADTQNHRIRRVDAVTQTITTVAGNGTAGAGGDGGSATAANLSSPTGVAVDATGRIYIADQLNNRIRRVAAGTITTYAGTGTPGFFGDAGPAIFAQLDAPQGLGLDAVGNLYIADTFNQRIRRVDAVTLTITTVAGNGAFGFAGDGGPATSAALALPTGVALDGSGNFVIADRSNNRIRLVEARTGRITTVAGNGVVGFSGDGGPATSARTNTPSGVALDAARNLFIADTKNQRVRRVGLGVDLTITKTDGQDAAVPGTPISYTLTVTNKGPITLSAVNVSDPVPPQIVAPVFTAAVGTYSASTGDWTGLSLGTGQSAVLTLTGTVSPGARGSLVNSATVSPPLGLSDPVADNTASDTDVLNPSADVALTKTGSMASLDMGELLGYTLDVLNSGPSDATSVTVVDFLPQEVAFISASAGCSYSAVDHKVTCNLGTVAPLAVKAANITVQPFASGVIFNRATVAAAEPDPDSTDHDASASTNVTVPTGAARFLTVTSLNGKNVLEWLNPLGRNTVRIRFNQGSTFCTFPLGPNDGTPLTNAQQGPVGGHDSRIHAGLTNGSKYCYTLFVDLGGTYSKGRSNRGRPFDTSGAVKLAYSIGTTSMAPPGVGVGAVHSVANDNALHAFNKATGLEFEGLWPKDWTPRSLMGPSQGRPSTVVATTPHLIYLGSQDGNVYATNADTGAPVWNRLLSPPAGSMVQAAPAGIFAYFGTQYGITYSYVLVGTRSDSDNRFYALNIDTGAPMWFVDGSPFGPIGAINNQASVDYATQRVYFTSRERSAGANTVWCVKLDTREVEWARPLGDSDASPMLRDGRLYVGTNDGRIHALDAATGASLWAAPFATSDGAVKGFILLDRPGNDFYFSTLRTVWKLSDSGATPPEVRWSRASPVGNPDPDFNFPSTPTFFAGGSKIWLGSDKGTLLTLDSNSGSNLLAPITIGDGKAAIGSPTIDPRSNLMYIGTEAGIVYAVQRP